MVVLDDEDATTGTQFKSWERWYKILQEYVKMRNGQLLTYKDNDKKDGVMVIQNIVELNLSWRDLKAFLTGRRELSNCVVDGE